MSPRSASAICYVPIAGWVPAIVVLASQKFRESREVRFHAFQGIYLFVAWLIVDWVISPVRHVPFLHLSFVGNVLEALLVVTGIVMLVKTAQGQMYKLPILGELAERSVSEQAV